LLRGPAWLRGSTSLFGALAGHRRDERVGRIGKRLQASTMGHRVLAEGSGHSSRVPSKRALELIQDLGAELIRTETSLGNTEHECVDPALIHDYNIPGMHSSDSNPAHISLLTRSSKYHRMK
jgi:hypothetical protein